MSDEVITDDVGDSVRLGTPYYDGMIGEFIVFERNGDQLVERQILTGNEVHSWSVDEFTRECLADDFLEMPLSLIDEPHEVVNEVMGAVTSDARDSMAGYEPWEVRFAWKATRFEPTEYEVEFN